MNGNKNKKNVRLNSIDEQLGRLLAMHVGNSVNKGECLSEIAISELIDGVLPEEERRTIIAHLNACEDCFKVFIGAIKTREHLEEKRKRRIRRLISYSIPSATAVAAVLLIVFSIIIQKPTMQVPVIAKKDEIKTAMPQKGEKITQKPKTRTEGITKKEYIPKSSREMLDLLAKNTDLSRLSRAVYIGQPSATNYGFSGGISLEKASFRTGIQLTDLEVALRTGEREKTIKIIENIIELAKDIEGSEDLSAFYSDMKQKIESGAPLEQFIKEGKNLERLLKDKDAILLVRFGEWVEAGRLAGIAEYRSFFEIKTVEYFIKNLDGKGLPEGVTKSLERLKNLLEQKVINEKEFKNIKKVFEDLKEIM